MYIMYKEQYYYFGIKKELRVYAGGWAGLKLLKYTIEELKSLSFIVLFYILHSHAMAKSSTALNGN